MCGISGIVGQSWQRAQLEAMVAIQHHRGPDDSGVYVDEATGVGLGHNRLSIIDLSPAGHQPMSNRDGTLWIVFNGEVYNYRELRAELADYPYRSQTDTEVILAAYERWGKACVEHFIGMFAFAIWDSRRQRLFCARDRLGIKPFHYAWHQGLFLFASEIKALLAADHPAQPDPKTWATYLVHGLYDHDERTFFEGVRVLPAGHTLTLQDGRATIRRYWDLAGAAAEPLDLSDDEAAERFLELLTDSVRLRLRSDVPVGVNLSGGLDSASMMVVTDELLRDQGEIQAFTTSFGDPRYDEQEYASRVARHARWIRNTQRLDDSQVSDLATEALWHQEAPYGGIATLAYHRLHRLARERGVIVLLEGQGGDELLAGYEYFRPPYHLDLLDRGEWTRLRRELQASGADPQTALKDLRLLRSEVPQNVYQDGTTFLKPDTLDPEVVSLATDPPVFPRPFPDRLTNALYRDLAYTKLPRVLRMNDRLSMAFSRELREPYLDHRIVELAFRLPAHQKIRDGRSKYLLRHAMAGRLPDELRLADKRAVVTPQREWLRTTLRPQVEEIIYSSSFAARGLFDAPRVQDAFRRFCAGEGQNAFFVWQWVNTELWYRTFIDASQPWRNEPRAAASRASVANRAP